MSLVNGSVGRIIRFCQADVYNTELDDVPLLEGARTIGAPTVPQAGGALYPVVEFSVGKSGKRTVLVKPESWKVELPNGEVQASRTQVRNTFAVDCLNCRRCNFTVATHLVLGYVYS